MPCGPDEPGKPPSDDKPDGQTPVLDTLTNLDGWSVVAERDPALEFYDFMTPRRPGGFAFEPSAVERPEKVRDLKSFWWLPRPEIYLHELGVSEGTRRG
jgi:hypothetical protein